MNTASENTAAPVAPSKLAEAGKVAGVTAVVAAATATYVVGSALLTFGWSKLGEKIWDAL